MARYSDDDQKFYDMRKEGKTYISKVFTYGSDDQIPKRNVVMVMNNSDSLTMGEIEGSLCLRLSGEVRKTQVTALITKDDNSIRRLSLQHFKSRSSNGESWYSRSDKNEFTFRGDEFHRLLNFLRQIEFITHENEANFQIEDISSSQGNKTMIDAADKSLFSQFKNMNESDRIDLFQSFHGEVTHEEINLLLGRRQALNLFSQQMALEGWSEKEWQNFFDSERWVFGYGLDYRIMSQFDREMVVGGGGTDNKNKAITDFLMTFTDYTVIVEIKLPTTKIFKTGKSGRSGTFQFSSEFVASVSQILEQKAEWLALSSSHHDNYNREGKKLTARTRNSKAILIIGSKAEFQTAENERNKEIMLDTFELFRQDTRSIDIITYDELYERACYIVNNNKAG